MKGWILESKCFSNKYIIEASVSADSGRLGRAQTIR